MANKTILDFNRRALDFTGRRISEVLPDYFKADYPKLITLFEKYYDFMDSDGNVNDDLRQVLRAKDIDGISLKFLDFLIKETSDGIAVGDFSQPREIVKNLPKFFRIKGSLMSAQSFFRALYEEEITVEYPKDNLFIVDESELGAESLKFIQNGALYQVLSVLIKSPVPISEWRDLYKKYVHPAGFFLGSEVQIEGVVDLSLDSMPLSVADDSSEVFTFTPMIDIVFSPVREPVMGFYAQNDSSYHVTLEQKLSEYSTWTVHQLGKQYNSIHEILQATSPTVDADSATTGGAGSSNVSFDKTDILFDTTVLTWDRTVRATGGSTPVVTTVAIDASNTVERMDLDKT